LKIAVPVVRFRHHLFCQPMPLIGGPDFGIKEREMWARMILICFVAATGVAKAETLDWMSKEKKIAIGQLIGGYTEGLICKKQVDVAVGGKFLEEKFAGEKLTPDQVAQISSMVIGLHVAQMGEFLRQKPSEQAVAAHCKKVYDNFFGPAGTLIPNLLK
jgi:hypothetical protein